MEFLNIGNYTQTPLFKILEFFCATDINSIGICKQLESHGNT